MKISRNHRKKIAVSDTLQCAREIRYGRLISTHQIDFVSVFAQHYFDRVEETFVNESNHQKLNEFLTILRCFDNSKENGAHLYLVSDSIRCTKRELLISQRNCVYSAETGTTICARSFGVGRSVSQFSAAQRCHRNRKVHGTLSVHKHVEIHQSIAFILSKATGTVAQSVGLSEGAGRRRRLEIGKDSKTDSAVAERQSVAGRLVSAVSGRRNWRRE